MAESEKLHWIEKKHKDTDSTQSLTFVQRELQDIKSINFWRAFFAEFIGTFILCFYTIAYGLYNPETDDPTTLVTGAVGTAFLVSALINALAHVSGGHINPILSIGFLAPGKITVLRFACYTVSQCCASVAATLIIKEITPPEMHGNLGLILPGENVTHVQALFAEFIISFLLLFGVFAFIDEDRPDNTNPAPFFVGMVVGANIICAVCFFL